MGSGIIGLNSIEMMADFVDKWSRYSTYQTAGLVINCSALIACCVAALTLDLWLYYMIIALKIINVIMLSKGRERKDLLADVLDIGQSAARASSRGVQTVELILKIYRALWIVYDIKKDQARRSKPLLVLYNNADCTCIILNLPESSETY